MSLTHTDIQKLAKVLSREMLANILAELVPGRWLTLKEAMVYANVKSVNTIKRWIDEGLIYGHKRSGVWIVDRESIDAWFLSEKY